MSPFYWGFSHFSIDAESLSLGKVVLASAAGIFSDGTPFDTPGQTLPPAPLTILPEHLEQVIHLAVPIRTPIVQVANTITITAKEELMLNGGGSYIRLNAAGIEEATAGRHVEHAAMHGMVGPKNAPTAVVRGVSSLRDVDDGKKALSFVLLSHAADGRPIALEPYTLYKDGAKLADGVTDAQGRVVVEDHQSGTASYTVKLANGNEFALPVKEAPLQSHDDKLAAAGFRAAHEKSENRRQHHLHRQDQEDGGDAA